MVTASTTANTKNSGFSLRPRKYKKIIKDARFNLRVRPQEKLIIEKAAQLRDTEVSNFIIQHAVEQAKEVLEQEGVMILEDVDRQGFVNAFLEPHKPSPYMRRAINAQKKD